MGSSGGETAVENDGEFFFFFWFRMRVVALSEFF